MTAVFFSQNSVFAVCLVIALLTAPLFSAQAQPAEDDAEVKSIWACQLSGSTEEDLFLVADGSSSYIKLYDDRIWGSFSRSADTRRWDFGGNSKEYYQYSIILSEPGEAILHDFGDAGSVSSPKEAIEYRYQCRLAQ